MRQRIGALALGYEDLNDHDRLRLDPLHALLAGKADVLGEDRLWEGDKGKALAAHSTLNRLELGALGGDARYKKIIAKPQEIEALLIEEGVKAIPRKSREITDLAAATLGQIRLKLFKIGARITISCRRIHLELV